MKVLVYGDISLNILDGSSIWMLSVTTAMSDSVDQVDVLLKEQLYTAKLSHQLEHLRNIRLLSVRDDSSLSVDSSADKEALQPAQAAERIEELDEREHYDVIFVRGRRSAAAVSTRPKIAGRTWAYITDLPYPPTEANASEREEVSRIASKVSRMVAQTEEARSYIESIAPAAAGATLLMPPIIPGRQKSAPEAHISDGVIRICYAGKFAEAWMTRELLELPTALSRLGIKSELWMIGDKFQGSISQPDWPDHMRAELAAADADETSGVKYLGALSRSEAIEMMSRCNFGVSWRSDELDSSLELSTKVLEYLSAGIMPLVNNSRANRELLGTTYDGFIGSGSKVDDLANLVLRLWSTAGGNAQFSSEIIDKYTVVAAAERLTHQLEPIRSNVCVPKDDPIRITFAYHDSKFLGDIRRGFAADQSFEISDDIWRTLHANDLQKSEDALTRSDVIFCEWAGPNLAWYSSRKRIGQALVCRFHGFEINGPWMKNVDFDAVDHISFVSEHLRSVAIKRFGIDSAATSVISNSIDIADLDRPKLPGSGYRLGLLGYVPFLKRPDRALDLVEMLLAEDSQYVLHIKGRPPWEYPHVWNDPHERQLYLEFFARIRNSSILRNKVVFEPFSPAVGSWLRKIGIMVSPSDRETFHLAVAEGMASGSVPVVWARDGAFDIFGTDLIFGDTRSMVNTVLGLRDPQIRSSRAAEMRIQASRWSMDRVIQEWKALVLDIVDR